MLKNKTCQPWLWFACHNELCRVVKYSTSENALMQKINPARLGIPRLQSGVECAVTRGRSRYPLLRGIIRPANFRALRFWNLGLIIIGSLWLLSEGVPLLLLVTHVYLLCCHFSSGYSFFLLWICTGCGAVISRWKGVDWQTPFFKNEFRKKPIRHSRLSWIDRRSQFLACWYLRYFWVLFRGYTWCLPSSGQLVRHSYSAYAHQSQHLHRKSRSMADYAL